MNFKSLMLGAAAVATAATGVNAADLPVAPEPVDYVRICDAYGARFFYIPGTDTCLRVGGRVRADYRIRDFADRGANAWDDNEDISTQFRARAYVRLDARTQTEFGLLRTYMDLWFTQQTPQNFGTAGTEIWNAFVQLGGFTFGKATSFYDGYNGASWGAQIGAGFDASNPPIILGYMAAFGNGFSAGLSIEADDQRRLRLANGTGFGVTTNVYGGHKYPSLVGTLRVDQGWGSAGLYGVVRQVYSGDSFNTAGAVVANIHDSPIGWAIAGDVEFNLPMVSSGTSFGLRAAYADGASGFVSRNLTVDAVATTQNNVSTARSWGILAGLSHDWTPTINTSFTGTYAKQDATGANLDRTIYTLHGTLAWTPVSGLVIGTEVEYLNGNNGGTTADNDALVATFRVQRTF